MQLIAMLFFPTLGFVGAITWLDSVSNRPLKVIPLKLFFFDDICTHKSSYIALLVRPN
jgi:hypothetical protein